MRFQGWEKKLGDYFDKMNKTPFKWGDCDCLIFASDWCKIISGKDPMSKKKESDPDTIRGMYQSEDEARELVRKYRKSVRDIMDVHFERIGVQYAQRGDIVIYKMAFGIVSGRGIAMFKTEDKGMTLVKVKDCQVAWRIE